MLPRYVRQVLCLAPLLLALLAIGTARAGETYDLRPGLQAQDLSRVEVVLQVGGDAALMNDGKRVSLPMSVVANISYDEKLLAVEPSATGSRRSIRHYDESKVAIKVDTGGQKPQLREDRTLIGAVAEPTGVTLYSPSGPLTRDELDLIDIPACSLIVDELLPSQRVAIGDTWSTPEPLLAALLGLDGVDHVDVTSTLSEVADGVAKVVMSGSLKGAAIGVGTEIELKAKYDFDLKTKRINWFALLVKEKRAIGHVGPGLDVVAKLIMKVTPQTQSVHLAPEIVEKLPTDADGLTILEYEAPSGLLRLDYDRRWYITSDEKKVAVMRLVDRGELVAQCNISPMLSVQKQLTLADYQKEIEETLGKKFGQFIEAAEDTNELGYRVFRVVASGTVADLPIQWNYYLVTSPGGERVSLAFTMESDLAQRFAAADRQLVASLRMFKPPVTAASQPATQR